MLLPRPPPSYTFLGGPAGFEQGPRRGVALARQSLRSVQSVTYTPSDQLKAIAVLYTLRRQLILTTHPLPRPTTPRHAQSSQVPTTVAQDHLHTFLSIILWNKLGLSERKSHFISYRANIAKLHDKVLKLWCSKLHLHFRVQNLRILFTKYIFV